MSDTAAPVAENKIDVPAAVEEAAPADAVKAEETTVSPQYSVSPPSAYHHHEGGSQGSGYC